ncbi:ATP-dependent DNA helicase PIF1 [Paramuricea clavata]|uniref:ATP-dependent DNA helicase n=1 Tax=Paramuricea clavata TaxID=317549 RepID=A0A6S7H6D4_PARCT|nr:ATP-dependent DNA helicase PIF1 [Paramuricea clavata]
MIQQLGPASLFCSFSSAETKWNHKLRILGKLVDHKDYSDEELDNLNWDEKCRLIQSDPVTCARHFDYQFNAFLKDFLMSEIAPLGKLKDWFYRVEYQQRGLPHIHMLIWLENAPVFGVDKDEDVVNFIDQIITCRKPDNDTELFDLVNRQTHRHSHTCRKKPKKLCRFNYPQLPMRSTQILHPLDDNTSDTVIRARKELWKNIKNKLNDLKEGEDVTFDQLLKELDVSEYQYILAIRSSLNCPTIFLKRSPNELRINNYNPACLQAWRANMDIQFVLDVYACAMYIVSYISKAQKGMSDLLRNACAEAKEGNSTIKQQVRDIGNKFLNSVEISAQEAVYIILQLPMRKSSRNVVFINTSPPNDRVELLKPLSEIEKMSDESEEIHSGGLLKRYVERPDSLNNITLADWAAWYNSSGLTKYKKSVKKSDIDNLPLEDEDENNDDDLGVQNTESCVSSKKSIKKRSHARIIRSVWFNKESQPEKHYRELIMLFARWRNEQADLMGAYSSFQEHYEARRDEISEQMQQYAVCSEDLNEIQHHLQECDDDAYDTIAPATQDTERRDENEGNTDTHPDLNETYDVSEDLGIPSRLPNNEPLILNEMEDNEYRRLVQMLNKKQREFFYHALHLMKISDNPFYAFLSGSGGVGKAAYLIKGNTIHSALSIPASQSLKIYKPLDSGRLNTLRCELGALKLILLDEISMVGNSMFTVQLNNRLKDLKGSKDDFGGVSIITIGDLFQFKPVMDGIDYEDVGRKTRQENRTLYVRGVQSTWTPIKPITTQFPVASAKTVHRSQGDTQTQIVVNLNSNRSFPHIHYVALSRVTTIEGLYITDLCEDKISVDQRVVKEMEILRTEQSLNLCFKPLYMLDQSDLKVCYLNARSLHKHIEDVRKDINYSSIDIVIFTETRFNSSDTDDIYNIDGYRLFRNDVSQGTGPGRPYGGTAVYSRVPLKEGYPYAHNVNGIEFTIIKTESNAHLNIIGVYRSPNIAISRLLSSLRSVLDEDSSAQNIIIGDFNVNWMVESDRQSLYNLMVVQNHYRQLIKGFTTDNRTLIDHLYTNLIEEEIEAGILETYFSDHKAIWASLRT